MPPLGVEIVDDAEISFLYVDPEQLKECVFFKTKKIKKKKESTKRSNKRNKSR